MFKSPFLIHQEFLSPLLCEEILDLMNITVPDVDFEGNPQPSFRHNKAAEKIVFERFKGLIPTIEDYYRIEYRATEKMFFEWYSEGSSGRPLCDSSEYINKKWIKTKDRDITGIIFLSEFRDTSPFDPDYEVRGGKLEFPQHGFGFNPERGTLVLFPSVPQFINATAPVEAGDLFQIRFHIAAQEPFLYNPLEFPGNYTVWFQEFLG